MMRFAFLLLLPAFFAAFLTSCASLTPNSTKRAYCNMLKSDLVFNGQTGVTREANIQNSETPLDQRDYNKEDCEDET